MLRHKSAASVKFKFSLFAAVYAWGIKQGIVSINPVKGVERPIAHSSLDYFSNEEVARLLITPCDDLRLSACLRLALHAGLRKGELLGLRWQDLDFNTSRLTVACSYKLKPKSGYARHLRLPKACIPALQKWKVICPLTADGLVFLLLVLAILQIEHCSDSPVITGCRVTSPKSPLARNAPHLRQSLYYAGWKYLDFTENTWTQ